MLFFLAAVCFSFCTMQPVYVAITFVMACVYLTFLKGLRRLGRTIVMFIPITIFIALLNSLFNTVGATVLWRWGIFSITLEGCIYGLAIGGIITAVLVWFATYNEIMTDDKFTFLFSRAMPTLALMVSMVSRWVPRMVQRGRSIYDSQEALIGSYDTSRSGTFGRGVRMATVLAGLGMEDSIQTSDSMRARGYGTSRRTSYQHYSWHAREIAAMSVLVALIVVNAVAMIMGTAGFTYYPRITEIPLWWGYFTYALMLALPLIVEVEEVGK